MAGMVMAQVQATVFVDERDVSSAESAHCSASLARSMAAQLGRKTFADVSRWLV